MPTFELELRNYEKKNGKRPIVIRVTIARKVKRKSSGYSVAENQWDFKKCQVKNIHPNYIEINDALNSKLKALEKSYAQKDSDGKSMSSYSLINSSINNLSFFEVAQRKISGFQKDGKLGSAARYSAVLNKIKEHSFASRTKRH